MNKSLLKYLPVLAMATLVGFGNVSVAAAQDITLSQTQATIQAENYSSASGVRTHTYNGPGVSPVVGYVNNTDSTTYDINVLESGSYAVDARVSSASNGGRITFRTQNGVAGTLDVGNTGSWRDFVIESTSIELQAGEQQLTLDYTGSARFLLDIDWFAAQLSDASTPPPKEETPTTPPLPEEETPTTPVTEFNEGEIEAASLLMAASFGPTTESIEEVVEIGFSEWYRRQQRMPIDSILADTNPTFTDTTHQFWENVPREIWYERAIYGEDQLRQRAAFALSQIFVVSTEPRNWLFKSHLHARYMDIMQEGVYGNFRDLMEDVTYSPLMGEWLTYIGNEKANASTGNAPDENYAREFMQLFTIGLLELDESGEPRLDAAGEVIETYDTEDVAELAKVFTGLWWDSGDAFGEGFERQADRTRDSRRMRMFDAFHSPESKSFLGHTIPAGTGGNESIAQALDVIFAHRNIAPFIGKQLIQRLTTSNPSPAYVSRVSRAFNSGNYTLPDGIAIGSGERGDMAPVWAAILFDTEARSANRFADDGYGKIREPVIRWVHWARLAGDVEVDITGNRDLRLNGGTMSTLGQNPYRAKSVFNFYRPGFLAGGSVTAANGLVAPELQITTSTTAVDYPNFMRQYIFSDNGNRGWMGSYEEQIALATDADALIDHLNLTMTAGRMTDRTKDAVRETFNSVEVSTRNATRRNRELRDRVQLAVLLVASSQEFNTQQ